MKTNNFDIDLMVPNQENKDVAFNEALLTVDEFLKLGVMVKKTEAPKEIKAGEKFLITEGEKKNQICYKPDQSKETKFLSPKNGMIIFLQETNGFMQFDGANWKEIAVSGGASNSVKKIEDKHFAGVSGEYSAPANKENFFLYMDDNGTIDFDQVEAPEITIVIKQHWQQVKTLAWKHNILWENNAPHKLTATPNTMDVVKLYRMPETTHFLGKIVGQNYKF